MVCEKIKPTPHMDVVILIMASSIFIIWSSSADEREQRLFLQEQILRWSVKLQPNLGNPTKLVGKYDMVPFYDNR